MLIFKQQTLADSRKLAHRLAGFLSAGDLILLYGDLGAGKTTFTRDLVQELGADKNIIVNSPTFTVMQQYTGHGLAFPVYHFDAYRLEGIGAADQGFEDYIGTDGLTLVEWPEYMSDILPDDYLKITFTYAGDSRNIDFSASGSHYERILKAL